MSDHQTPTERVPTTEHVMEELKFAVSMAITGRVRELHDIDTYVNREAERLVLELRRKVYAERLLTDRTQVPFETRVTVYTPGRRVWYAPWRRRDDVAHYVTARGEVTVEARHLAAYPDFVPPRPPDLGGVVRYSTLGQVSP